MNYAIVRFSMLIRASSICHHVALLSIGSGDLAEVPHARRLPLHEDTDPEYPDACVSPNSANLSAARSMMRPHLRDQEGIDLALLFLAARGFF